MYSYKKFTSMDSNLQILANWLEIFGFHFGSVEGKENYGPDCLNGVADFSIVRADKPLTAIDDDCLEMLFDKLNPTSTVPVKGRLVSALSMDAPLPLISVEIHFRIPEPSDHQKVFAVSIYLKVTRIGIEVWGFLLPGGKSSKKLEKRKKYDLPNSITDSERILKQFMKICFYFTKEYHKMMGNHFECLEEH